MGKKKSRGKTALRVVSAPERKPRNKLERAFDGRAEAHRLDWVKRHPDKAKAERALRIDNIGARERWKHKRGGTVQTLEHASRSKAGALARLYQSGAIGGDLLDAGVAIARAVQLIMRDVDVRTADYGTRVDIGRDGDKFWESLGRVWLELAYSAWRSELGPRAQLVLAIVCDDIAITAAARRFHLSTRNARELLIAGLERWRDLHAETRSRIDARDLDAAHAMLA